MEIRTEINQKFIECGQKYYEENEMELQKIQLIDAEYPCANYCETISAHRPTLGCRALVQRSLRMINIVVNEMCDWKESVRVHSLKLLWEVVLFAEKAFTCKFMEVFPILAKSCQDDDVAVRKEAQRVTFLMGQLLNFNDCMAHAMKTFLRSPSSLGTLRCISSFFAGADYDDKENSIEPILKLIVNSGMCHNLNGSFQNAIFDFAKQMVAIYLKKMKEAKADEQLLEERYLFEILVKTIALTNAHDDRTVEQYGIEVFNMFCVTSERQIELQNQYTANVIDSIEDLDCEHSELSERIIMLYGCIKLCGFQSIYFDSMASAIKLVMKNSTANAKIKILSAVSIVRVCL